MFGISGRKVASKIFDFRDDFFSNQQSVHVHLLCEQDLSCYWHIYYTSTINAFAGWCILLHVLILALGVHIIHVIDGCCWEEELFCCCFFCFWYCTVRPLYITLWQTLYDRDRIYFSVVLSCGYIFFISLCQHKTKVKILFNSDTFRNLLFVVKIIFYEKLYQSEYKFFIKMTAFFVHIKIMEFGCMFCSNTRRLADEKIYWFLNGNYLLSRYKISLF